MATFDQLPADQRAIIELVLQRGQSYEDLSDTLGMSPSRVRDLARDALADLTPATANRVDEDWRGQVADYVLGQQSGPESTATRGHLKRSEAARTWALSLLDALDPLFGNGSRPEIPEGGEAEPARSRTRERRPATAGRPLREPGGERRPTREPADRPLAGSGGGLSSDALAAVRRRRIIAAAAAAVLVLLAVLVWPIGLLTGDNDDGGDDAAAQQQPQIVGSPILLEPTRGGNAAGSAVIVQRGDERVLILQAQGLRATPQNPTEDNPGFAYEVWLYNSRGDAVSIGAQLTDANGNLQGAGPVPENFESYRFIDVSRESIDQNAQHSGRSVLRGDVSDIRQPPPTQQGQAPQGQAPQGQAPQGQAPPQGQTP